MKHLRAARRAYEIEEARRQKLKPGLSRRWCAYCKLFHIRSDENHDLHEVKMKLKAQKRKR